MSRLRIFHLTRECLTVQRWEDGYLREAFSFNATPDGLAQFGRYVAASPDEPSALLADLVEEEFVTERVPHVPAYERRQLRARRAERLFPATRFRAWLLLGREREGRRDDRILFSALTGGAALEPWLDALARELVPLRAISSVSYAMTSLPRALGLTNAHLLLVSLDGRQLRQTFFSGQDLCASRLGFDCDESTAIFEEIARTRRYLQSAGWLPAGSALTVALLAEEPRLSAMESVPLPEGLHLRTVAVHDLAARLRLEMPAGFGMGFVLGGLLATDPRNRYAAADLRAGHRLWRARRAIEMGGIAAAVTLSLIALFASMGALRELRDVAVLEAQRREAGAAEVATVEPLPDGLTPEQMQRAVEGAEQLVARAWDPAPVLASVGTAVARHPEVRLTRVEWAASSDARFGDLPPAVATTFAPAMVARPGAKGPFVGVVVAGEVDGAVVGLRGALASVEALGDRLRRQSGALSVELLERPVDPMGTLAGGAGRHRRESNALPFSIRAVFGHG